jgi:heptaprenyl diphosphate synthase
MPQPGNAGPVPASRKTIALLGAFCLFLSTIEYMIPKPLPFMRLGIANLPLMLALDSFPIGPFLLLTAIKVFGQAIITGTVFSYVFLFSLAGTTASALSMYLIRRLLGPKRISFIGVGAVGALLSNMTQLALAAFFLFGAGARYIARCFGVHTVVSNTEWWCIEGDGCATISRYI